MNTTRQNNPASWLAGLLVCLFLDGSGAFAGPSAQGKRCVPAMVQGLFPAVEVRVFKVLITELATDGPGHEFMSATTTGWMLSAAQSGINLWQTVKDSSPQTAESLAKSRFVQGAQAPCIVTSHDEARRIGQAAGAQLVLWGSGHVERQEPVAAGPSTVNVRVNAPAGAQIGSNNHIEAGPGAKVQAGIIVNQNNNIYQNSLYPDYDYQFNTTLVSWRGAAVKNAQVIEFGPLNLAEWIFPRHYFKMSTTGNINSFIFHFIDLINKYEANESDLINTYSTIMAGFVPFANNPGHWVYLLRGTLAMRQKNRELAGRMFQTAAKACTPTAATAATTAAAPRCSAEVALALAWYHGQIGETDKAQQAHAQALQLSRQHNFADLTQRLLAPKSATAQTP